MKIKGNFFQFCANGFKPPAEGLKKLMNISKIVLRILKTLKMKLGRILRIYNTLELQRIVKIVRLVKTTKFLINFSLLVFAATFCIVGYRVAHQRVRKLDHSTHASEDDTEGGNSVGSRSAARCLLDDLASDIKSTISERQYAESYADIDEDVVLTESVVDLHQRNRFSCDRGTSKDSSGALSLFRRRKSSTVASPSERAAKSTNHLSKSTSNTSKSLRKELHHAVAEQQWRGKVCGNPNAFDALAASQQINAGEPSRFDIAGQFAKRFMRDFCTGLILVTIFFNVILWGVVLLDYDLDLD
jgi:hypothetical protein